MYVYVCVYYVYICTYRHTQIMSVSEKFFTVERNFLVILLHKFSINDCIYHLVLAIGNNAEFNFFFFHELHTTFVKNDHVVHQSRYSTSLSSRSELILPHQPHSNAM